jgi:hypothetical protein
MGVYMQDEPNQINKVFGAGTVALGNAFAAVPAANPLQTSDKRWDVEFGAKGPIGNNGHWDYDLGFAYTNYEVDVVNNVAGTNWISPEMQGWMGHVAVKWDSKKEWAAKLAYTFADDESMGGYALDNDQRYQDGIETPFEDISRGNVFFRNGLMNMYDLKLQAEYRPRDSKHYFRLAADWLDEMDDTVTNDMTRYFANQGRANAVVPATKGNNTRIRVGYTQFDMTGDAYKAGWVNGVATPAQQSISAGRGLNSDYDYNMFWAEIYSQF